MPKPEVTPEVIETKRPEIPPAPELWMAQWLERGNWCSGTYTTESHAREQLLYHNPPHRLIRIPSESEPARVHPAVEACREWVAANDAWNNAVDGRDPDAIDAMHERCEAAEARIRAIADGAPPQPPQSADAVASAVAAMKERCARVAEDEPSKAAAVQAHGERWNQGYRTARMEIAAAIRALGDSPPTTNSSSVDMKLVVEPGPADDTDPDIVMPPPKRSYTVRMVAPDPRDAEIESMERIIRDCADAADVTIETYAEAPGKIEQRVSDIRDEGRGHFHDLTKMRSRAEAAEARVRELKGALRDIARAALFPTVTAPQQAEAAKPDDEKARVVEEDIDGLRSSFFFVKQGNQYLADGTWGDKSPRCAWFSRSLAISHARQHGVILDPDDSTAPTKGKVRIEQRCGAYMPGWFAALSDGRVLLSRFDVEGGSFIDCWVERTWTGHDTRADCAAFARAQGYEVEGE